MLKAFNKVLKKIPLKSRLIYLMVLFVSAGYTASLRSKLFLPLLSAFIIIISIYYLVRRCVCANCKPSRILILVAFALIGLFLFRGNIDRSIGHFLNQIHTINKDFSDTGGWVYNLSGDFATAPHTPGFLIRYSIEAFFHFMAEPLPTHLYSMSLRSEYPAMVVWYFMLFLSPFGMIKICRIKRYNFVFILSVFMLLYSIIVGLSVVNIGTAVRFRDAIMPIMAILASCGLAQARRAAEGCDG